ncbi:hypothetical protein P4O66_008210 [Electrophorus voltai]|uniref:Synaptotagmin-like protein 5 n=1 Tax=Electrophorus voltai TaxID=2609070 RepID=A0AAD9E0F9_9TELE|nr:hypothetical protein P4O66_008210 [Electrophorus voltai]
MTEALNLSFLLEHEREMILSVLQKDEKLRKREEKRIRKLKNELLELRRAGRRGEAAQRECGVCLRALGLVLHRGSVCVECQRRVCSLCTTVSPSSSRSMCAICAKTAELKVVTGEWFLEERAKRYDHRTGPSSDVVKQSILSIQPGENDQTCFSNTLRACLFVSLGIRVLAVESSGLPTTPNNMRSQGGRSPHQAEGRKRNRSDSVTPSIAVSRASLSSDRSRSEVDLSNPGEGFNNDPLPGRSRSVPGLNDADSDEDIDGLMSAHYTTTRSVCSAQSVRYPGPKGCWDILHNSRPSSFYSPFDHFLRSYCSFSPSLTPFFRSALPFSQSSTPGSERKWGYLNVPNLDAETSSLNSMMSVYSETGDYGNAHVSGEILLTVSYSYKTGALNILVRECRCLATGDERRQRTDPYVKTYLLPDKSRQSKRKTSIKINTTNPVFNENLRYVVSHSQLETRTLQVSVWHHDRFGHNSFLGETELTFDSWEFDTQIEEWFSLQPRTECSADSMMQYKGELTVVLKYIPAERNLSLPLDQIQVKRGFLKGKKNITLPKGGMVELLVKEAKNLTAVKSGSSDPFVKGYLLPDDKKSTKHKTAVVRRSVNPRWNHTFTYCGLQHSDLDSVCLELTVWDKEPLASNVFLGGVRLGAGTGLSYGKEVDWNDSYGEEQQLWQQMIDNPEVSQECTLMLRSSMAKRKT